MIHLYSYSTPNSYKVSIALEELKLPYKTHPVNVRKGEHMSPDFLRLNPAGKVPVIRDDANELVLSESNAILIYLAEAAQSLLPNERRARALTFKWLMFQAASVGPMFGEHGHYTVFAKEKVPYAIERYTTETQKILTLLEEQLVGREYLVDEYSIADIAHYGWLGFLRQVGLPLGDRPNLVKWLDRIAARPAVQKGVQVPVPFK